MGVVNKQDTDWFDRHNILIRNILLLIIVCSGFIWLKYFTETASEAILKTMAPLEFHGKVDSVFRDEQNHNDMYVRLSSGYAFSVPAVWETTVGLGDSLSKKRGKLVVEVFKKDRHRIILDYQAMVNRFYK